MSTQERRNKMKMTYEGLAKIVREEKEKLLKEMSSETIDMGDGVVVDKDDILGMISDYYKEQEGIRAPDYLLNRLARQPIKDVADYYKEMFPQHAQPDYDAEDSMGYDDQMSRAERAPKRQGMKRRGAGSKSQRRMESIKPTHSELRKLIREALNEIDRDAMMDLEAKERAGDVKPDLSTPVHIDDLPFIDDGNGAMMMPGPGFSYSVREDDFEAKKAEIKKKYGDDVRISVPNPSYPKARKLHSKKFDAAQSRENQNFLRHQKMMSKRLGRKPGLGT